MGRRIPRSGDRPAHRCEFRWAHGRWRGLNGQECFAGAHPSRFSKGGAFRNTISIIIRNRLDLFGFASLRSRLLLHTSRKRFIISKFFTPTTFEIPLGSWSYEIGIFTMHERKFDGVGNHRDWGAALRSCFCFCSGRLLGGRLASAFAVAVVGAQHAVPGERAWRRFHHRLRNTPRSPRRSQITAFLIDTLPIIITPNPFA
jgi:hypothetical protein